MALEDRIDDGFSTLISFADFPTVEFYEKDVTPPGIDGGEEIDTTTMRNNKYRTYAPRQLVRMTPMTLTVSYTSEAFNPTTVLAMTNVNQEITMTLPDGSTLEFWGYVKNFQPSALQEGSQPTGSLTIVPTMTNTSKVETDPVFTAA